jgi:hypothetical protein
METTSVPSGGSRYSPHTKAAFASKSGPSSLITHCSSRCGLISAARRISCACDSLIPTWAASSECVQRVRRSPSTVSGGRVQASAIRRARTRGPCTSGRPGRGASRRPARPSASKRRRHFFTVRSEQPTSPAIRAAERPSPAASTIRARSTARRSALRERTIRSSSRRSSAPISIRFAAAAISISSIVAHQDDNLFDRKQPVPANGTELTGATTRSAPRRLPAPSSAALARAGFRSPCAGIDSNLQSRRGGRGWPGRSRFVRAARSSASSC